jgi:hypothetical protein
MDVRYNFVPYMTVQTTVSPLRDNDGVNGTRRICKSKTLCFRGLNG